MDRAVRRAVLVISLSAWVTPVTSAAGQTVGATTGAINGTVVDKTGAVLPGVTVVASSDAVIGNRGTHRTVTNQRGLYRFPALPPGDYQLVFARDGFRTVTHEDIYVGVGFTATVNVELDLAALNQNLIVERNPPVADRQSSAITTNFTERQLANLPGARSMWAVQAATPAVVLTRSDVGGSDAATPALTTAYGTNGANRPMVEGILVAGINPTGFTLDYGSFEEVSVGTAAHGPEWQAPGVQMQFISKSGGNQYRGTVYSDYEHRDWQSFNIDEDQIRRGAEGGGGLSPRDGNRLWGYHDINADVGGYIRRDTLWWYSSYRWQDVSARQVNFAKPLLTSLTNYTGKATYQIAQNDRLVAFGQVGRNHQPHFLRAFAPATRPNLSTGIHESDESTSELRARGSTWKSEWNSVINDDALFEIRVGQFGATRLETPNGTSPRFEDSSTLIVRGRNRDWQQNLHRNQVVGSLSYFRDSWFGNHHFKLGVDIDRTTQTEIWNENGFPADVLHVLRNRQPTEVYVFQTPSMSEVGLWTRAAYASDSWRLNDRLTINLGLRFDRLELFLPEQTHPAGPFNEAQTFPAIDNLSTWNVVAPRLGGIYAVTASGRTLLKFTYGQYWDSPGTNLGFNANPNSNQWWRRYEWSDLDQSGVWESGEEGRLLGNRGGAGLEALDPGLDLPFVREVTAAMERKLVGNVGVRTAVVWRSERQHYMRQNTNRPFEAFTVPVSIPDPGGDGEVGTPDDLATIRGYNLGSEFLDPGANIVRNVPNSESRFWTWEVTANKRFSGRWSLVAGFAHTWHGDQADAYLGQSVRQNTYPLTPNDLINAGPDGRHEFRTWSAKIHGTYEGPWNVLVTPYLRHQSGQPFGRTLVTPRDLLNYGSVAILAEPLGTRRMDNITLLDVRIEKGFTFAKERRVAGFIDIFNMLNANSEQNTNWSSGSSFLRPLSIVGPRIARIGAKLEW